MTMDVTSPTESLQALGLGASASAPPAAVELGQNDFLTLMMTQLQAQDPLKPLESSEFLSELAQFSTVSGIDTLNKSFATLADSLSSNQTLQASQLVGRSVLIPGETATLDPVAGLEVTVDLPALVPDLTLDVYDDSGTLVRSLGLQGQGPGLTDVKWDGLDDGGEPLPAGRYRLAARGSLEGETQAFEILIPTQVESVAVGGEGQPLLAVGEGRQVTLDQVREIR